MPGSAVLLKGGGSVECAETVDGMLVQTEVGLYEIEFGQTQIEITGRCNMNCQHCRAADDARADMPLEQILKIVSFARRFSPNYKEILLSGGEPLLHAQFAEVATEVRRHGGDFVTLTTNGSLLESRHIDLFAELAFERLTLSVSLDSLVREEHDAFRRHRGAFTKAMKAIRLIAGSNIPGVVASVRTTLQPHQIPEMERIAEFVYASGCHRLSFSAIHPAGVAKDRPDLWMSPVEKRQFLEEVYRLKGLYPAEFNITTNDPLKCLVRGQSDIGADGEIVFDGCPAAAVTFNVNASGRMTPCALLDIPIMNVFDMTIDEMVAAYQSSQIVKDMLDMNLGGKCGDCDKKYQCGGCRARAFARCGDFLATDPDCWR